MPGSGTAAIGRRIVVLISMAFTVLNRGQNNLPAGIPSDEAWRRIRHIAA